MESKLLKPYKGFLIEKSWEEWKNGSKHNIVYTAYTEDGNGVFDADQSLSELKKKIDQLERRIEELVKMATIYAQLEQALHTRFNSLFGHLAH